MNEHELPNDLFHERFDALDATARAALVFRYREELPLAHVAELVERHPDEVVQIIGRALRDLQDCGALSAASAQDELWHWFDKLRDEPALSSFSLVLAVRTRQRPLRRRVLRRAR